MDRGICLIYNGTLETFVRFRREVRYVCKRIQVFSLDDCLRC